MDRPRDSTRHLFEGVQEKLTQDLDELRKATEGSVSGAVVVTIGDRRRKG
jgi:hypothetical protein